MNFATILFVIAAVTVPALGLPAKREVDLKYQVNGGLAQAVDGLVVTAKTAVKVLEPVLGGMIYGVVPILKFVFKFLDIYPCSPNTLLELVLWDVVVFYNTELYQDLGVARIEGLCDAKHTRVPTAADRVRITGNPSAGGGAESSGLGLPIEF